MLSQKEALELKKIIEEEAPELDAKVVEDEIIKGTYHLEVVIRYAIAIRSLDEWHDRKRLLTER